MRQRDITATEQMKKMLLCAFAAIALMACNENTPVAPVVFDNGTLPGQFSVSNTTQIRFSQGNLQYQASTKTWRFAENQWNYAGKANKKISDIFAGWIDFFGWGTGNHPTDTETDYDLYFNWMEWGQNRISNGGNKAGMWRTMTRAEWVHLLYERDQADKLCSAGKVAGVKGLILLPDAWVDITSEEGMPAIRTFHDVDFKGDYYTKAKEDLFALNTFSVKEWRVLEQAGAVFLPASGSRLNPGAYDTENENGSYWTTATYHDNVYEEGETAYFIFFGNSGVHDDKYSYRYYGRSVRLVRY